MRGNSVALDTNVAISVLAGDVPRGIATDGVELILPVPVVGELRYGALNSVRSAANLAAVERLTATCRILTITPETAAVYASPRHRLRKKGQPIPENDVWIAALCVQHQIPLASFDHHFDAIEGLTRQPL